MKMDKKIISKALLGFVGVQFLSVGVGLYRHYSSPQKGCVVWKREANGYHQDEIFYSNPIQCPIGPIQHETKEFKAYIIGSTTGSSGDCAVMTFPV